MLPGVLLQGLRDVMWIRTGTFDGSFKRELFLKAVCRRKEAKH